MLSIYIHYISLGSHCVLYSMMKHVIIHLWMQCCVDVHSLLQAHVQAGGGVWGVQRHREGCVPPAGREGLQAGRPLQEWRCCPSHCVLSARRYTAALCVYCMHRCMVTYTPAYIFECFWRQDANLMQWISVFLFHFLVMDFPCTIFAF